METSKRFAKTYLFSTVGVVGMAVLLWSIGMSQIEGRAGQMKPWLLLFAVLFTAAASHALLWLIVYSGVREGNLAAWRSKR